MNDTMEGIVLKQSEYRENDALLEVFFKDIGKVSLVLKGVLKANSKNKALATPYTCSDFCFDYDPLKSMFLLKTGVIKQSFYKIHENLGAIAAANLMKEILEKFIVSHEPNEALYDNLYFCLNQLHQQHNIYLVVSFFTAQCLKEIGIEPEVDECVNCANQRVSAISLTEGGFVCLDCAKNTDVIRGDIDSLRMFRYLNKASYEQFNILLEQLSLRFVDTKIMVDFLMYHTGIKLVNWRLFEEWTS